MRKMLLWLPFVLAVLAMGVFGWNLSHPRARRVESALVGQPFPQLQLPGAIDPALGLDARTLADGKPRLVNVFASWCVPCAAEAPMLKQLQQQGVEIIGIAVSDNLPDLMRFLAINGNPYGRIGMDPSGRVQIELGSAGVPETFIVDGKGRIVRQHIGIVEADDVAKITAEVRSLQ